MKVTLNQLWRIFSEDYCHFIQYEWCFFISPIVYNFNAEVFALRKQIMPAALFHTILRCENESDITIRYHLEFRWHVDLFVISIQTDTCTTTGIWCF